MENLDSLYDCQKHKILVTKGKNLCTRISNMESFEIMKRWVSALTLTVALIVIQLTSN